MNAVDLFAGAGGLSLGLIDAGIDVKLAIEIEPDFAATYEANHPNTSVICNDISKVHFDRLLREMNLDGKIDLLCGGPPCQGFSTVGKKDQQDPRNKLFYQFLRAVDECDPDMVLFENVSGFQTMYQGRVYEELVSQLEARSYSVSSRILDAADFGLPQFRKRTIVVATRGGPLFSWPIPTHGMNGDLFAASTPHLTINDAIGDLPALKTGQQVLKYTCEPRSEYQHAMRNAQQILTEHNCANYGPRMQEILREIPPGGCVHDLPERLRPNGYFANTYARLVADQPSPTITRNFGTPSSSRCVHPTQYRALSTREGARLQSFPDSYQFIGSKTSKNLQIGNAVPPLLGRVLGESLVHALTPESQAV